MSSNRMTLGVMALVLMTGAPVMAKQQASDYETQLVQQIQQHWRGDKRLHGRQCVDLPVHVEIDGTVSAVGQGSGDAAVCNAARATISRLKHFPAPPKDSYERYKNMLLTLQPGIR